MEEMRAKSVSLSFQTKCRKAQAMKKARMARLDLPERPPTGLDHTRLVENADLGETSFITVTIPITAEPIPPASRAAETGPLGFSISLVIIVLLIQGIG